MAMCSALTRAGVRSFHRRIGGGLIVALLALVHPMYAEAGQRVPTTGSLAVTSFPSGAEVFIDGVSTHTFTPTSMVLSLGAHTVRVAPGPGWTAVGRAVTVVPGMTPVNLVLQPVLVVGPPGPQGPEGPQGPQGPIGPVYQPTFPYTGTVSFTNANNVFVGDGSGLSGVAAASAVKLENATFGATTSLGCSVSAGVINCPPECFDLAGVNTCQILVDPAFPSSGWMRLALLTVPPDSLVVAQLGANAVWCNGPHASLIVTLQARMQKPDFRGSPPARWPDESQNVAFGNSVAATVTPGVVGAQFLSQSPFSTAALPRAGVGGASYVVFVKATPSPDFVESEGCYLMQTPVSVATLPWTGQQVDITPK